MTRLDKPLKREIRIKGKAHVLTVDPNGFKLTKKGRRKGIEIEWDALANGDAAMTAALNASLGKL
jgi:ribosomal protein S6E (S10)